MAAYAKSISLGVGAFERIITFGPFPRLSLVDSVTFFSQPTTDLTDDVYTAEAAFFSVPPQSATEFESGHFAAGPISIPAHGASFFLPVGIKRQPKDYPYVCVLVTGNNTLGTFVVGATVTVFPPRSQVETERQNGSV